MTKGNEKKRGTATGSGEKKDGYCSGENGRARGDCPHGSKPREGKKGTEKAKKKETKKRAGEGVQHTKVNGIDPRAKGNVLAPQQGGRR